VEGCDLDVVTCLTKFVIFYDMDNTLKALEELEYNSISEVENEKWDAIIGKKL
jgi:hypothetical protein